MLLTASLALLAQAPQAPGLPQSFAQQPQAPAAASSQHQQGSPALPPGQSSGGLLGTQSIESFETPNVAAFTELDTTGPVLDENAFLVDGQGPNLVLGDCSYTSAGGVVQFNGPGHYGQQSQTIGGFPSPTLTIDYDAAQTSVSMLLNAYDSYPELADVIAYDGAGNVVDSVTGISLPDGATQIPVSLNGVGIVKIDIIGTLNANWSPVIDDHVYSPAPAAFEPFEGAIISLNGINTGLTSLDDTSILADGQGPGLVQDGCTYSCAGGLWWNGDDYFGQRSQTFVTMGGPMTMTYDYLQNGVGFTVCAYEGYADTIDITAYDQGGGVLQTFSNVSLPSNASPIAIQFTAKGIKSVVVGNNLQVWSGNIDNHQYDDAPPSIDKFEGYDLPPGGAQNLGVSDLDADSVINGQGPGLVARNVRYSAGAGNLQWNDRSYFGQTSRNIVANNNGGLMEIHYNSTQSRVNFTLASYLSILPDTATCTAYDIHGNVVDVVGGISIPDEHPVPVSLSSLGGIARVEIQGIWSWSPAVDHHGFTGSDYALSATLTGPCPGVQTLTVTGGRPGAGAKMMYSLKIGGSLIPRGLCTGVATELAGSIKLLPPVIFYDANGEASLSNYTPPNACGKIFIQMVDQDCNISNVIAL